MRNHVRRMVPNTPSPNTGVLDGPRYVLVGGRRKPALRSKTPLLSNLSEKRLCKEASSILGVSLFLCNRPCNGVCIFLLRSLE